MTLQLYFAYGSNLSSARLRGRVPSASARGSARAPGYALRLDKRGADGSGKANLHPGRDSLTWGAVYALDPRDWPALDACETRYARFEIEVWLGDAPAMAQTYRSDYLTSDPVALAWYKRLMLEGAREHRLPEAWCAYLASLPAREA